MRWVVYVDMDAFYVACELRDRPELRGRPVVVGPDPKAGPTRGVVLSASYEARAFGLRSAMPAGIADRQCPDAVWIPADFAKYERLSHAVVERLGRWADDVRPLSIDESALTVEAPGPESVEAVARSIQADLRTELDLPASIGVSTSRPVAKIASDQAKPGGVRVVAADAVAPFLAPLPVGAIPGVGPKTSERLGASGFVTIGDLATRPLTQLRSAVGGFALELRRIARGEHVDPVERDPGPRSRSVDRTFPTDRADLASVVAALHESADELGTALDRERFRYQTVSIGVRWSDFARVQRSRTLPASAEGAGELRRWGERLLVDLWHTEGARKGRAVRGLSVGAERLTPKHGRPRSLDAYLPGATPI